MILEPIYDFDREVLPKDAAKHLLLHEMLAGRLGLLVTDLQWDYFFPEYMKADGRFSPEAIKEAQAVTATTYNFLNDFKSTGVPLHKFWAVHACFPRVRRKLEEAPALIRYEPVIRPDAEDDVFAKDEPCPFYGTKLDIHARKKGVTTLLDCGGLFEVCVAYGLLNGMHTYDFNMILMPDATLTKRGYGADYIRGQFTTATQGHNNIRLGVLDTTEVMEVARIAASHMAQNQLRMAPNAGLTPAA